MRGCGASTSARSKREIKRLRAEGVLKVKRPGVRGRVATYTLDHEAVERLTKPAWRLIGADFEGRMAETSGDPEPRVVPFRIPGEEEAPAMSAWSAARRLLQRADPARYTAWFAPLVQDRRERDRIVLRAPSAFHADYVSRHMLGELSRAIAAAAAGYPRYSCGRATARGCVFRRDLSGYRRQSPTRDCERIFVELQSRG